MSTTETTVVLEPAARALAEATANPPFLFELAPKEGRQALEDLRAATTLRLRSTSKTGP